MKKFGNTFTVENVRPLNLSKVSSRLILLMFSGSGDQSDLNLGSLSTSRLQNGLVQRVCFINVENLKKIQMFNA